jgi:hypothetical protein
MDRSRIHFHRRISTAGYLLFDRWKKFNLFGKAIAPIVEPVPETLFSVGRGIPAKPNMKIS